MAKVPKSLRANTKDAGYPRPPSHYVAIAGVDVKPQLETYWCWAAVTAAVHNYFDSAHNGATDQVEQCEVVERVKGLAEHACCGDPDTYQNETEWPNKALSRLRNLKMTFPRGVKAASTKKQIDAGNPMAMYISRGGNDVDHVALIAGYAEHPTDAAQPYWLLIQDPSPQRYLMPFEMPPEGGVAWTKTYYTKAH